MGTFSAGFDLAQGEKQASKQRKQAMSDADLESHLETYGHAIDGLTQKLSTVAPGSAEHTATQADLAKAIQERTSLLHPDNNPGALQRFGRRIAEKLHALHPALAQEARIHLTPTEGSAAIPASTSPGMPGAGPLNNPELPAIPAGQQATLSPSSDPRMLRAQAEANLVSSGAPDYHAPILNSEEQHQAARIKAGIDEKALPEKPLAQKQVILVDVQGKQHIGYYADGQFHEFQGVDGLSSPAKPEHQTADMIRRSEYGKLIHKDPKDFTGRDEAGMLAYYKKATTPNTVSTHTQMVQDGDHFVPVQLQSSSSKVFGGSPGTSQTSTVSSGNAPTTPASLKRAVVPSPGVDQPHPQKPKRPSAGVLAVGGPVGHKISPAETKASEAVDQAEGAYRDVKQASEKPTSLGDKGIVLAWLRGRVNRVTKSEIDSVSNLGGAKFAFENGVARIVEGKMSNAQRQWFLKSAEDNYTNAKAVASKYSGAPVASDLGQDNAIPSDMVMATIPGVGTKPIHRSQVEAFKKKHPNGTVQ